MEKVWKKVGRNKGETASTQHSEETMRYRLQERQRQQQPVGWSAYYYCLVAFAIAAFCASTLYHTERFFATQPYSSPSMLRSLNGAQQQQPKKQKPPDHGFASDLGGMYSFLLDWKAPLSGDNNEKKYSSNNDSSSSSEMIEAALTEDEIWRGKNVEEEEKSQTSKGYDVVINWTGNQALKDYMKLFFRERNAVCDVVDGDGIASKPTTASSSTTLINITFGCGELFRGSGLGTGNYIAGFYAIRLAAQAIGKIDVSLHCEDFAQERGSLILPWLTGRFLAPPTARNSQPVATLVREGSSPLVKDAACKTIDACPIGLMYRSIQYELRRMAVALVGVPTPEHSTSSKVRDWLAHLRTEEFYDSYFRYNRLDLNLPQLDGDEESDGFGMAPVYPDVELDDVIIHFRCGDLMDSQHPRFGFLKFDSFAKHISSEARSIGVVTQPFDNDGVHQTRAWDSGKVKRDRCRIVVGAFVEYLQERIPGARVRVHNSPDETIALTYARLVLANQTVAGISTFGVFPAIASFGTGYIRLPDERSATNKWLTVPLRLDNLIDGLVLMDEPNILMVRKVRELWERADGENKILDWFRDPEISYS